MTSVDVTYEGSPWPWYDGPGLPTWMPLSELTTGNPPSFTCKITPSLNTTEPAIPVCVNSDAVSKANYECSRLTPYTIFIQDGITENGAPKLAAPSYPEEPRDACVDYCNMVNNGTLLGEYQKCWDERCVDGEKLREENSKIIEFQVEILRDAYCKRVGLLSGKDVRSRPVSGGDDEEKDGDVKDGEDKGGEVKDDEKKDDAEKKDKDSAAVGLGVKKRVAVLALVFGSVFSGLIL